jgi:hypothetical protein
MTRITPWRHQADKGEVSDAWFIMGDSSEGLAAWSCSWMLVGFLVWREQSSGITDTDISYWKRIYLPAGVSMSKTIIIAEHRMRAFQCTFHPMWYGWSEMQRDSTEIKELATDMRRTAKR